MPFPLILADRTVANAAELTQAVTDTWARRSKAPAATSWLPGLVQAGQLTVDEAVALCGVLVRMPDPRAIATAAQLATLLGHHRLGPVLLAALNAHDLGALLLIDPLDPSGSLEDHLVDAALACSDFTDDNLRGALLERLRNAGLRERERTLLCRFGSPDELLRWLPDLFSEAIDATDVTLLGEALVRPGAAPEAVRSALDALPPVQRARLAALCDDAGEAAADVRAALGD